MASKRRRISTPPRRRRNKRRRRTRMRITKNVVPDSKIVRLRYVDTIAINPALGSATSHVFRANGIHDPDFSGIGHQPLGHDEWAQFYDHYTVLGAKITATFISQTSTATTGTAICGILLKDNTTVLLNTSHIMEQTNSGYRIVTNASAGQKTTVRKGYSTRKFFGLKDISDNRGLVGAQFDSLPPEEAYFHVYVAPTQGDQDPGPFSVVITIEYICKFTERKSIAQS